MSGLLLKLFVKDYKNVSSPVVRARCGSLAGTVCIFCNVLLFSLKLICGSLSGSIAITADAFNNLSDAASNIIALIGFKLSSQPADEEHPFGHARYEYIASLAVALIILFIGTELLKSSVMKIISPQPVFFSALFAAVLVGSMAVKAWMAFFNLKIGKHIDSTVLKATAKDSSNDVIATFAVLLGALVSHFFAISLDGWFGLGVSLFIIFGGFGIVKSTLSLLLGKGADDNLVKAIDEKLLSYEGVIGAHDLLVHDYGPGHRFASAHVEMDSAMPVMKSHDIIDDIERDVMKEFNINLVIHYDPILIGDKATDSAEALVKNILKEISPKLSMHDFRMVSGDAHTKLIFDVVLPHGFELSEGEVKKRIDAFLNESEGNYYTVINFDYGKGAAREEKD